MVAGSQLFFSLFFKLVFFRYWICTGNSCHLWLNVLLEKKNNIKQYDNKKKVTKKTASTFRGQLRLYVHSTDGALFVSEEPLIHTQLMEEVHTGEAPAKHTHTQV